MDLPEFEQYAVAAEVTKLEKELGPGIHRLTLQAPEIARAARPGQFVMLRVASALDPLLRRPFSIHRILENGLMQVLFREVGKGTSAMAKLREGDSVSILGPLGRGFRPQPGPICLVGGGMGVAPLLFLAEWLAKTPGPDVTTDIHMLYGARNKPEIVGINAFESLGVQLNVSTDDGSLGHHGLVTDVLAERSEPAGGLTVYACGPHPMLRALAGLCKQRGWRCQVSLETMMACGIRACLGCAVPSALPGRTYVHVCKDGPVFDMEELAW